MANTFSNLFKGSTIVPYYVQVDKAGNLVVGSGNIASDASDLMVAVFRDGDLLSDFCQWYRTRQDLVRRTSAMFIEESEEEPYFPSAMKEDPSEGT